jgi:chemotaxis protein MotA
MHIVEDMHIVEEMMGAAKMPRRAYARAPVAGAAFGLLLLLGPVVLGARGLLFLFSLGGLAIVVGGVIAVAFMSFDSGDVREALDAILRMFKEPAPSHGRLRDDMADILRWSALLANRGRRGDSGIADEAIEDHFVKYGLNMALSDYAPEDVRDMMETAADACYERDSRIVDILHSMTSHAPAFGMVGTLIGMVALLGNLSDSISGIAPSLAVAFLSTLYGVLSARMVYMPAAARLRQEIEARRLRHHFLSEGIALLAAKKSPLQIQDRLNSFLRPASHDYFDCFTKPAAAPRLRVIGA